MKKQKQRIVNIIGMANSARNLPDYGENWGINHCMIHTEKQGVAIDKLFVMDGISAMFNAGLGMGINVKEWCEWVAKYPDMSLISAHPDQVSYGGEVIRICELYPIEPVVDLIPGIFSNSSLTMMLAYACVQEVLGLQKIDEINIYGVELWASAMEDEYYYQKECVNFWIPFLYGRGIRINVPAYLLYSKDTKHNLYGYYREGAVQPISKGVT